MGSYPEIEVFMVFDESDDSADYQKPLNISYGVDTNYLDGVGVSITSVIINNKANVAFHIFCDKYPSDFISKIQALAEQYKIKVCLYLIDAQCLEYLPQTKVWSRAMYYRLFSFDYLSEKLDRLLYLDADVVCKGSLIELLSVDLDGKISGVVKDVDSIQEKVNDRLPAYNLRGRYFNSGVVYVNLIEWSKHRLTEKALALLNSASGKGELFKYPDQDALNILLMDKVVFLPREYNTIYTIKSELKDKTHNQYQDVISDNTVLIHYTGATKPWHAWANYPSVSFYNQALLQSPWRNSPAKDARTLVEFKKRYKHLLVQKHYLRGLINGTAYLYRKILANKK